MFIFPVPSLLFHFLGVVCFMLINQAFSLASQNVLNSLPKNVWRATSFLKFRRSQKTDLFPQYFLNQCCFIWPILCAWSSVWSSAAVFSFCTFYSFCTKYKPYRSDRYFNIALFLYKIYCIVFCPSIL